VIFSDFQRLLYNDAYFRACQNGVAKNTRISVMIVGQDRGGKTSLKKHLLGQDFDPEELSTDGIEVDVVELTDENAKDPWKGKETEFLKSANEVDEHILEYTAKLVTENEQNQKSKSDAISSQSEETLPEEKFDKIDKLRNNVNSESLSTTVFLHDFAGQSIYYDTHFCFLKTACPYLLVVDVSCPLDDTAKPRFKSRDSERDLNDPLLKTNFDYLLSWLTDLAKLGDVICSEISSGSHCWRYKLPPVVIVLTNSGKFEAKYIKEVKDRIKAKVKMFQNVFTERIHVIDNTSPERNNHEIRELRQRLYDLCKEILEQQLPMPVRWLRLEVELGDKMKEGLKHITLKECHEVAKFCKVKDVDSALDFLHNQGIIVHHKKSQVVVLDPPWLMNLFTKIITVPKNRDPIDACSIDLLQNKGILKKEDLEKKVGREHLVLEELMKQFSLLCPLYYEEGSDVQEQLSKSPNAYIVPSVVPLLKKGRDLQKELSQSPIASVLLKFNLGYVPIGFYTRFQTTMIKRCVEKGLLKDTPQLFSNFTLLILNGSEGYFFVYLIKIQAKIEVDVVPGDESESTERANCKFVSNLKRVLLDCTQRVKEEEPLIYRNVTALLEVKCSCMENRQHWKRRHSALEKKTSSIGKEDPPVSENLHDYFWPLKKLQTYTEDFVYCPRGNTVKPGKFFLDRVKPWLHPGTTLVCLFYFILAFCDISVLILFKKVYSSCFYEN
jgi:hypothetical protein